MAYFLSYTTQKCFDERYLKTVTEKVSYWDSKRRKFYNDQIEVVNEGSNPCISVTMDFYWMFLFHVLFQATIFYFMEDKELMVFASVVNWWVYLIDCGLAILPVHRRIKRILIDAQRIFEENRVSDEQQRWMEDKNLCPACGNNITKSDTTCSDCGLVLS